MRQIATVWKDSPETLPFLKQLVQSDKNYDIRCEALQQIVTGWKNDPGMFQLFYNCNCALKDPYQHQDVFFLSEENRSTKLTQTYPYYDCMSFGASFLFCVPQCCANTEDH